MTIQTNPRQLGKFIYYRLRCSLKNIVVPFDPDTQDYIEFIDGFRDAFADQNRQLLRLSTIPGKLEAWCGIKDADEWLMKVKKPVNDKISGQNDTVDIKKLIEEATIRTTYPGYVDEDNLEWNPPYTEVKFNHEKFAELIADKCASIAYKHEHGEFAAMDILYEFNVDGCRSQK
jgi:hypothetical protein